MKRRWLVLSAIALTIIVLDQWSKMLAIKHLTPGLSQAHAEVVGGDPNAKLPTDVGALTQVGYFLSGPRHPCSQPGALCPTKKVVHRLWHWKYAENPGAAWSFLATAGPEVRVPFFISISILAVILIIWFYSKLEAEQRLLMIALSLVLGGAVGNLIDRARLTYVIDFIVWYIGSYRWPTFNVADSAISVGVGLLFLDSLLDWLKARKEGANGAPESSAA